MVRSANGVKHDIPIAIAREPVVGTIDDILRIAEDRRILRVCATCPAGGVCPVGGNLIPPESIVIEPARLLETNRFGHTVPWWATEVVDTALRVENGLIRILGMYLLECLGEATDGAAIPVHCHTSGVLVGEGVLVNGISIRHHLEDVLVEAIDSHIAVSTADERRSEVVLDKLGLDLWGEIHALPTSIIAHRFVNRGHRPDIDTFLLPRLDVSGDIVGICLVVLRQKRTATGYAVLALVVLLVVLHPCRRSPCVRHDAISIVGLTLLDIPNIKHEVIEVVLLVLHLWVLAGREALFVTVEREELHIGIAIHLGESIFTFYREVGRTDLSTNHREVSSLFREEFVEHALALLFGQAGEHESRRLGERATVAINGLLLLVHMNGDSVVGCAFVENDGLLFGTFITCSRGEPHVGGRDFCGA